ncbi:MAG: poly-gamma-glutamate system protein [Synergistaceae bacterium]|nr:poly-gamma-glutamate system protein [Synergistaceae bacterium]
MRVLKKMQVLKCKDFFNAYPRGRLYFLALVLAGVFALSRLWGGSLTHEESRALSRVRAMHASLWEWLNSREVRGNADQWNELNEYTAAFSPPPSQVDPFRSGLIGVEWSDITTTLGPLEVKQASTDPAWAVHILRWFDQVRLVRGDSIAVFASSSFPGFLVSLLAAAEERGLQVDLAVSLGSSTWGANRMEAPWPLLEHRLRQTGRLRTRALYYTPGGRWETGLNYTKETMSFLEGAARTAGVPLLRLQTLEEIIAMKINEIGRSRPKLVVFIGGSASVTGGAEAPLPPGLIRPRHENPAGKGVARAALESGIPVLHLLNVRALSRQVGLRAPSLGWTQPFIVLSIILFFLVLATHRRWSWEETDRFP